MPAESPQLFSAERVRADFPALHQQINGQPLVYLDNAATSQKPQCVIDAIQTYYERDNSNVHRGVHTLSERATAGYEGARDIVRRQLNAGSSQEIIFTRGTTEAINLVAQSWGHANLNAGDEILITAMEHHSNIVPWQLLCEQTGAVLKVAPIDDSATLLRDEFTALLSARTRLVAIGHISNAFGSINPIRELIAEAHAAGAVVLVDGAQAMPHACVDVQALDCDFYAFSGHKVYGPTGIGVLYGKQSLLDAMPPWQGGGEMIKVVSFDHTEFNALPHKFEAGTPNIAGAIGLGAALEYLSSQGVEAVAAQEQALLEYATAQAEAIPGLHLIGTSTNKAGILSFIVDGAQANDIGTLLDQQGVAIRVGHHCAMPAMARFGVGATARASFAMYNTRDDVDRFITALQRAVNILTS